MNLPSDPTADAPLQTTPTRHRIAEGASQVALEERILGVETGACPHTAVREDPSMNLAAVEDMEARFPDGDVVLIEAETDRVYHGVNRPLLLREYSRSLGINADSFPDVVVWNPWVARSAAIADLPDDGFRRMLCVEAAAAREPVRVPAGENWSGRQTLVAL